MRPPAKKMSANTGTKRAGKALTEARARTTESGLRILARILVRMVLDSSAEQQGADANSDDEIEYDHETDR